MRTDLPTLLEKLRAATGGDREIDALIHAHFFDWRALLNLEPDTKFRAHGYAHRSKALVDVFVQTDHRSDELSFYSTFDASTHYTADLSAVVALVEAKLPGAQWDVSNRYFNGDLGGRANIKIGARSVGIVSPSQTPALALLCAFVEAIAAQAPK